MKAHKDLFAIDLDGFKGRFTLIGAGMNTMNPQLRLAGDGQGMKALVLATGFGHHDPWLDNQAKAAEVAVLACTQQNKALPKVGQPTPEFLRDMRQGRPHDCAHGLAARPGRCHRSAPAPGHRVC